MRRRLFAAALLAIALPIGATAPAGAHAAPPCNDSGEPGHSDYAQHHIVPLAHEGALGKEHVPGTHRGFSTCL